MAPGRQAFLPRANSVATDDPAQKRESPLAGPVLVSPKAGLQGRGAGHTGERGLH